LDAQLQRLHLGYVQTNYQTLARKAAEQQHSHVDYLAQLVEGEFTMREMRSIERRIRNARFPVRKTLDDFQWSWPKKINRLHEAESSVKPKITGDERKNQISECDQTRRVNQQPPICHQRR
jgi:DNA replication protein DnaC